MKIVAIGGGGFTHAGHPELDTFCLAQTGVAQPRAGFIGTASRDDKVKIDRFFSCFEGKTAALFHLPSSLSAKILCRQLQDLNLVYVGGGNTEGMIAAWRENGWDEVLKEAGRGGLTLAGVSAGAVCWFDRFLYSSGVGPMRPLPGLGLICGGACPHYSTEPQRRAALHDAVRQGTMPASIAIDDGAAVAFDETGPTAICSAEEGASAHLITRDHTGKVSENTLIL